MAAVSHRLLAVHAVLNLLPSYFAKFCLTSSPSSLSQSFHGGLIGSRALQNLAAQVPYVDLPSVDLELRAAAFAEAADIFAALVPRADLRGRLLRALASLWGLPDERYIEQYESLGKPTLSLGDEQVVVVGRVMLPRTTTEEGGGGGAAATGAGSGSTFASTGHAMRMMERVAAAIGQVRRHRDPSISSTSGTWPGAFPAVHQL